MDLPESEFIAFAPIGKFRSCNYFCKRTDALGCVSKLRADLDRQGIRSKQRVLKSGRALGGVSFGRGALYHLLRNRVYRGEAVHKGIAHPGEHEAIVDENLWNGVQLKLTANIADRRRSRIESGALLVGLVFDDRGNRMSPTYTIRKRGRYRYYVSQALLHDRKHEGGSRARVNADDLERAVVERLLQEQPEGGPSDDKTGCTATPGVWNQGIRDLVRQSITRIIVYADAVEIVLARKAREHAREGLDEERGSAPEETTLRVPFPNSRPRARKEILVPGSSVSGPRRVDQALVLALARARTWLRALQRGEYKNTAQIARRFDLSEAHIRRLLRLAFLAPDIVEAIVEGRQPGALTVKVLLRSIPLDWNDQRSAFGFAR